MSGHALSHLTVLDLSQYIAGSYCAKLMAGFGATVIKVERPHIGEEMRSIGPFFQNEPGLERSIPFLWLNTGKKSITLNLKTETGREIFKQLVCKADVVVENFPPNVMPDLGLSYDALREVNPRLVMTSISSFGQTGPYRDYKATEIVEYALGGLMYSTGDPERSPLCSGPAITQYTAGMEAYIATLLALYQSSSTGRGQHVDVSIQECGLDNIEVSLVEYLHLGKIAKRANDEHTLVPWRIYPCKDGYAAVIGGPIRHWLSGATMFEEPRLLSKKYEHMADRMKNRSEVNELIQPWLNRHTKKDIYHIGQARRLAFGYVATLAEVSESLQHKAREFFVEIDHPIVGKHQYCGAPFHATKTPWRSARAPLLGEHNEEVYGDLFGYSSKEIQRLQEEGVI